MSWRNQAKLRGRERGFTLIELIVVIVILGVLAAMAVSKFLDAKTEARTAVLKRARVEVIGGANLAHLRCQLIAGCAVAGSGVAFIGPNAQLAFMYNGYPTGKTRTWTGGGFFGIKDWVNVTGLSVHEIGTDTTEFRLDDAPTPTACLVRYNEAYWGSPPTVIVVSSGC